MSAKFRPTHSASSGIPVHGPFRSRNEKRHTQKVVLKFLKISYQWHVATSLFLKGA